MERILIGVYYFNTKSEYMTKQKKNTWVASRTRILDVLSYVPLGQFRTSSGIPRMLVIKVE